MKIEEYKKYQVVEDWINTINPSKNTEDRYLLAIKVFCEWTGKDPETLITEAESEILSGVLPRQRAIKRDFIGFRRMLQEKGYAPMTVKGYMSGIKSFYRTADIELPNLPRTGKAVPLEEHKEIPTKEDLRDVLKICDPLEKAMLLVGASSGLSSNEILNLKVGDFKKGYCPDTEITTLSMRRKKVNYDFITFLSPEASRAVWDYINYRGRTVKLDCARREKQIEKQRIFSDSDYLFIGRKIPDTYLQSRDESERKLERDAFMRIYRAISEKAQKNAPKNDWNKVRSHNVRKFFNSTLLNAGADSFFTEFLMGHTLDDTKSAYFRASPEKLKEIYKKYIPYLTIQKELDISESPEYLKIKQENQILQAETARHVVERSELSELRKELNELKERDKLKSEFIESMNADPEQMFTFMEEVKRFMDKGKNIRTRV